VCLAALFVGYDGVNCSSRDRHLVAGYCWNLLLLIETTGYSTCPQFSLDTPSLFTVQQATVSVLAGNILFAALLLAVGFVAYKLFGLLGAHCCDNFRSRNCRVLRTR